MAPRHADGGLRSPLAGALVPMTVATLRLAAAAAVVAGLSVAGVVVADAKLGLRPRRTR